MSSSEQLYLRAQENLEFPEVLGKLAGFARSEAAISMSKNLKPSRSLDETNYSQKETADSLRVIQTREGLLVGSYPEVTTSLKRAKVDGAVLSLSELYEMSRFLTYADELSKQIPDESSEYFLADNIFYNELDKIKSLSGLTKELKTAIISEDELSDNASPQLRQIRRNIQEAQVKIRKNLEKLLKSVGDALQEQLITIRRGRFVLPVKAENKRKVAGIVHDTSNSGQTLFIEPLSVVEENNNLRELAAAEQREIDLILERLSSRIRENHETINANSKQIIKLDFMQAKARLAQNMRASKPLMNDDGRIKLIAARHPHIDAAKVIPIDIELGSDYRSLLITGPNTGGKSVSLKTVGLLSLMAMSGLHIPAADKSELSIFENIYTDIGDKQSIAEDLSTFSAHMKTLVEITENVQETDLVLVDELGSGTDPNEGAALAIAVIEYLLNRNCVTVVTTHYKELKVYAIETEGIENASMEFDEDNLTPTYRVLLGVPGTSHAFSIAERMGLNEDIISRAQEEMSDEELRLEKILADIEKSRIELEERTRAAEKLEIQMLNELRKAENEKNRLEIARQDLARDTRNATREELKRQTRVVDELIDELEQKISSGQNVNMEDAKALRSMLRTELRDVEEKIGTSTLGNIHKKSGNKKNTNLGEGDDAFSPSLNLEGKIITSPDSKGQVQFRAGQLTVTLPLNSLSPAQANKNKPQEDKSRVRHTARARARTNFSYEIKLIGLRVEEALHKLDNYLDDAVLSNAEDVRIIHGKGTGALKNAVHEFLRTDRRVVKYELATYGEGDAGVTIASLRA